MNESRCKLFKGKRKALCSRLSLQRIYGAKVYIDLIDNQYMVSW